MRIAVLAYPGVSRACYQQLIAAAFHLAKAPRMQEMARWSWARFSGWLHALPFELDTGNNKGVQTATKCTPPQRMREFPPSMNCWERVLHQLAWFAARGASRATIYDHDTLVGRHIEVLVPATTNLGGVANAPEDQARDGILAGLQGGLQGGAAGLAAGPYGALAGFLLGAGAGVVKRVLSGGGQDSEPKRNPGPTRVAGPTAPGDAYSAPRPTIEALMKNALQRPPKAKNKTKNKRKNRRGTR